MDIRTGQAAEVITALNGPFDFVLNDADKENCIRYVELLFEKLTDRAVVLTDNTIDLADDLAEFVAWIRRREDFFSVGLPVGNVILGLPVDIVVESVLIMGKHGGYIKSSMHDSPLKMG